MHHKKFFIHYYIFCIFERFDRQSYRLYAKYIRRKLDLGEQRPTIINKGKLTVNRDKDRMMGNNVPIAIVSQ